jgi:hypothetical protein
VRSRRRMQWKGYKKGLYSKHPRETASRLPKNQIVRDPDIQRWTFFDAVRRGF